MTLKVRNITLHCWMLLEVCSMEIVLSFAEFVGVVLGFIALVILVYVITYEYKVWRRKRLVKALVRVTEK